MMPRSLRARLLVGATAITAAALIVLGFTIDEAVRHVLLSEFDAALLAKAQSLASMVEQHRGRVAFEFDPDRMPEFKAAQNPEYFEIWLEGRPFARSASLADRNFPSTPDIADYVSWTTLPDGRRGRAISFHFKPYVDPDEKNSVAHRSSLPQASLIVARDTLALDRTRSRLRWAIILLSAGAVTVCGAALLLLVHLATRPVRKLAARIEAIDETDPGVRLDGQNLPSELSPVVDRLNELLGRLAVVLERERAFTADAAHELRTPLAGLRATLEVCRARPREAAGYEGTIDKTLEQIDRLQTLVENLLLLARAESGQVTVQPQPADVVAMIDESWAELAGPAARKGLRLKRELPESLMVTCDPPSLRVVINNLLDNAVSHADPGGEIRIHAAADNGAVQLTISNTGSRLAADDVPRVFERFWRGDASRTGAGRHVGLGLGLCRRLLSLGGNSINVESMDGIFTATISLTIASPSRNMVKNEVAHV